MKDEAERIAASLTEAQREYLMRFDLDAPDDQIVQAETPALECILNELLRLGLAAFIRAVFVFGQLTCLGLEVRRILEQSHAD
jgi:hypothetical protein